MISKMMLESRKLLLAANAEGMLPVLDFESYNKERGDKLIENLCSFITLIARSGPMNSKFDIKDTFDMVYSWNCWQAVSPSVSVYVIHKAKGGATFRLDYVAEHRQTSRDDMLENLDALTQLEFERRRYAVHVHTYSISISNEPEDRDEELSKIQNFIDLLVYALNNFMYKTSSHVEELDAELKLYIAE